jgi:hypothetical protein
VEVGMRIVDFGVIWRSADVEAIFDDGLQAMRWRQT